MRRFRNPSVRQRQAGHVLEGLEGRRLLDGLSPDTSFDSDGVRTIDHRNLGGDVVSAAYLRQDSKLLVGGSSDIPGVGPTNRGAIARYNPDGSLDLSFGDDGKTNGGPPITALAPQADGRILAFGFDAHSSTPTLARFTEDGKLDPTFGTDGVLALSNVPGPAAPWISVAGGSMATAVDGSVFITATRGYDCVVLKLTPAGTLDGSFGNGGAYTLDLGPILGLGGYDVAYGVSVTADGRPSFAFRTAGSSSSSPYRVGVARLTSAGGPDATFGTNGISATISGTGPVRPRAFAHHAADGSSAVLMESPDFTVARWTGTGQLDGAFGGGDGVTAVGLPTAGETGYGLSFLPDGRLTVAGTTGTTAGDAVLLRLTTAGNPDASFDGDGWRTYHFGGNDRAVATLLAGGDMIAVGTAFLGAYGYENVADFAVLRVDAGSGAPKAGFGGGDGIVTTSGFTSGADYGVRSFPLPDGKVLVTSASNWYGSPHTLARLNPDGSLDRSFADAGRLVGPQGNYNSTFDFDYRNGKIVVLGGGYGTWYNAYRLLRFNADGSADASFGNGGTAGLSAWIPHRVRALPDDRVVVLVTQSTGDYAVVRYTAAGQLDTTFGGGDGIATVDGVVAGNYSFAEPAMHLADDGTVTVAGSATNADGGSDYLLARIRPDGSLDPDFGTGGVSRLPGYFPSKVNALNTLAIRPDGKIVAGGFYRRSSVMSTAPHQDMMLVLQTNADGSIDRSFGNSDGKVSLGVEDANRVNRDGQHVNAIALLPGGGIVIAGQAGTTSNSSSGYPQLTAVDAVVAWLTPNGHYDQSYGNGRGWITYGGAAGRETFADVVVLPDGRLLLTGTANTGVLTWSRPESGDDVLLLRLKGESFTVAASAPAAVVEGGIANLFASATLNPGQAVARYEWDFDYNGISFDVDATGASAQVSTPDGPRTRTVALRATDSAGRPSANVATRSVTVTNAAPTVASVSDSGPVDAGSTATVSLSGHSDASPDDLAAGLRHSFDFNNDGTFEVVDSLAMSATVPAAYLATPGTRRVRVRVGDKDGGYNDYFTDIAVNPGAAQPLTLRSVADAYVRDGSYAGQNFGNATELQLKKSSAAGSTREAYLKFDILSASSVGSAKLRLNGVIHSGATAQVAVYAIYDKPWTETGINWNNRPPAGFQGGVVPLSTQTVSGGAAKWYEWDVTSFLANEKAAGRNVVTLLVRSLTNTDPYLIFSSDEAASNRPELIVTPGGGTPPPPPQELVVSTQSLTVPEASKSSFTVQLASQPTSNVVVSVSRASGDTDLSVAPPSTLTFTPANWSTPQGVWIAGAEDADSANGSAAFTVSAAGVTSKTVTATEVDNDPAGGTTLTLRANADSYVRDASYAGQNFGTATQLVVKSHPYAGNTRESYLRFGTSDFAGATSATLRVFAKSNTAGQSVSLNLFGADNVTWSETGVNWNNKPAAGAAVLGAKTVSGTGGAWYEFDVTQYVQQRKAAGATAVTFVLKGANSTDAQALIESDESTATANRPQLVVTTGTPPPPPQGLVVSAEQLSVPEGGTTTFTVRLAAQPSADVIVRVTRSAGDLDIVADAAPGGENGVSLTFTAANWNVPQVVPVSAAQDADAVNGVATIRVVAVSGVTGIPAREIPAMEVDDDAPIGPTVLRATADAYVRDGGSAAQNFGAATELQLKKSGAGSNREVVLKFDLTTLSTVGSAKLRLWGRIDSSSERPSVAVFGSSNTTWPESGVNWNNRPATAGDALATVTVSTGTQKWYEWDVTSYLQSQKAAGATSVTLVLRSLTTATPHMIFSSDESGTNRPELTVVP